MKNLTLIIILFVAGSCFKCIAQTGYEPKILILAPNEFAFDPGLKREIDLQNAQLKKKSSQAEQERANQTANQRSLAPNLQLMQKSAIDFLLHIDFSKQISLLSQEYLAYRFYEKFPNCLVLLRDQKSGGSKDDLQKIATEESMAYVVNFSKLSLYKQNRQTYCKIRVQLFEQQSNTLLIDHEYTGDWNNPGFEFSCEQGSLNCTINNALSFAMPDIISRIASNNPTLIKEKELAEKRSAFIENQIYPEKYDDAAVRKIITSTNNDIQLEDLYHCFYSPDGSKFVAFFIKKAGENAGSIMTQKKDQNVKVITKKDVKDPAYFTQTESTYAYVVRGVLFQNKWYIEKTDVTYFDAKNLEEGKVEYLNNLQEWDFFAEGSAEPSKAFWEGKLFEKIKDKRLDPNWEKYKKMWETEERENREYIGQYELVADQLKNEKEAANSAFRKRLITDLLIPFYDRQVKSKLNHISKAAKPEEFNLIYPADMHIVINPIKITDENGVTRIRYFVFFPQKNEVYEWTLITPHVLGKNEYTDEPILKTMNALTTWDYSYKTLDDQPFWDEKVLTKEGAGYKYLRRIE
jgi:hypothetical protein